MHKLRNTRLFKYFTKSPIDRFSFIFIMIGMVCMIFPLILWLIILPIKTEKIEKFSTYSNIKLQLNEKILDESNIKYDPICVINEAKNVINDYDSFTTIEERTEENRNTSNKQSQKVRLEEIADYPTADARAADYDIQAIHNSVEFKVQFFNDKITQHLRSQCGYKIVKDAPQFESRIVIKDIPYDSLIPMGFWIFFFG